MKYKNSLHYCLCKRRNNIIRNRTWSSMFVRRAFLTKMGAERQRHPSTCTRLSMNRVLPLTRWLVYQWNAPTYATPSSSIRREDTSGKRTSSRCGSWRVWGCDCYSFHLFSCPSLSRFLAFAASLALLS